MIDTYVMKENSLHMKDEEVEKHTKKIFEMFENIPNPLHHPIGFSYYMRLYDYYTKKKGESND